MKESDKSRQAGEAEVKKLMEEAAAAKEEVIKKTRVRRYANITEDDFVEANPTTKVLRKNQYESGCWVRGPGNVELFAASDADLTAVAAKAGMTDKQVSRVYATRAKNKKLILLRPADKDDTAALPVNRYSSSAWINLVHLLTEARLTVETGWRERYHVERAPDHIYGGKALIIDMTQSLERRYEGKKKQEEGEQANAAEAEGKAKAKRRVTRRRRFVAPPTEKPAEPENKE